MSRILETSVAAVLTVIAASRAELAAGVSGETPERFKIALIGDSGNPELASNRAEAVLELIRDEGAELVLHQGDLGYDNPAAWIASVNRILGDDFPYFFSPGNHDGQYWVQFYRPFFEERLERLGALLGKAICSGDFGEGYADGVGMRANCVYRGLHFVLSDIGFWPGGSGNPDFDRFREKTLEFTERSFADGDAIWRICSWHASEVPFTVAPSIPLGIGFEPYELCKDFGAIAVTGHSHSYSRSRSLIDMADLVVDPGVPDPDRMRIGRGTSFVVVTGLGGAGISPQTRCLAHNRTDDCGIWGSTYTATHGALFVEFYIEGDPRRARGYFENIDREIIDEFEIRSENGLNIGPIFLRGDANGDRVVNISDGVAILASLFGARELGCDDAADSNDDGALDISDAVRIFGQLFLGGPRIAAPSRRSGRDFTEDELGCADA